MMQLIVHKGRKYRPVLKDGKLDVVATVAYGSNGYRGNFMLSVYLRCCFLNAGSRGGTEIQHFDIPVSRTHVPGDITPEEQVEQLTFMMNVLATQMDTDYVPRLPISPKKQVSAATRRKYEAEEQKAAARKLGFRTLGELIKHYEEELWHSKT